jgi:hypothetical protein
MLKHIQRCVKQSHRTFFFAQNTKANIANQKCPIDALKIAAPLYATLAPAPRPFGGMQLHAPVHCPAAHVHRHESRVIDEPAITHPNIRHTKGVPIFMGGAPLPRRANYFN